MPSLGRILGVDMSEGLFFPTQSAGSSGGSGGTDQYVKDSFLDYTKPADNNTGLSSTISTNPTGSYFGNSLAAKYSTKTLYIKDLVLEEDRSKWISGAKTYQIIFNEDFPGVYGYTSGNVSIHKEINGTSIRANGISFVGISGQILKASFLVRPVNGSASRQVAFKIDSAVATMVTLNANPEILSGSPDLYYDQFKYFLVDDGSANQSNDLHDFRITSTGAAGGTFPKLEVIGIVIYLSTDSSNVMIRPGKTFVDKALVTTTSGVTLALPAQNASLYHLGAKTTFFENQSGSAGSTTYQVPLLQTQATGLSGTNTMAVSAGTGASFPIGTGINIQTGLSNFLGIVQSVSTDTLTVSPTLPYAMAGATLTKSFFAPQTDPRTASISSSIYELAYSWDPVVSYGTSQWVGDRQYIGPSFAGVGSTNINYHSYYDPENRFAVFPIANGPVAGGSLGQGYMVQSTGNGGWAGPIGIKGDFQAIEFEYYNGNSQTLTTSRTTVDGITLYATSLSLGMVTGSTSSTNLNFKIPFVSDLGIGFHTFRYFPDPAAVGTIPFIQKVNFYKYKGVSIAGRLHSIEQNQTQYDVSSVYDTPVGAQRFFGADKLAYGYTSGTWERQKNIPSASLSVYPGYAVVVGSTVGSALSFKYWGKNFTLFFDNAGGSFTTTLDGGAITPTNAVMFTVATETIHTINITRASGTFGIQGIAILKDYREIRSKQSFLPINAILEGSNLRDGSVPVQKAGRRYKGLSSGIGGFAISDLFSFGISVTTFASSLGSVTLETSGNPVMFGLCSTENWETPLGSGITQMPGIYFTSAGTTNVLVQSSGGYGWIVVTRTPQGSTTLVNNANLNEPTGLPGAVAKFQLGNLIGTTAGFVFSSQFIYNADQFQTLEVPPAGNWKYEVYASANSASLRINNVKLFAMEMF